MNKPTTEVDRIWDMVLKVMVAISIAYIGWSGKTLINTEKRVSVIEATRYTPATALDFERETQKKFDSLTNTVRDNAASLTIIKEMLVRIEERQQGE